MNFRERVRVVDLVFPDPWSGSRVFGPVCRAPVRGAERSNVNTAGRCNENEPANLLRVAQRDADRDHAAHRLGNEIAPIIKLPGDERDEIIEPPNVRAVRLVARSGPAEKHPLPAAWELIGDGHPEGAVARCAW